MAGALAFLLLLLLLAVETAAVKVLQFQGDGRYTTESFVYSPPIGTDVTNFTLCLWFKADYWRLQPFLFQFTTHNNTNIFNAHLEVSTEGEYSVNVKTTSTNIVSGDFLRHQWNKLCFVSRIGKGASSLYVNGIEYPDSKFERQAIPGEAVLGLGQEQDSFKGAYDVNQAFSGWIANFGLSEKVLTYEQIERITACKEVFRGDLVTTEDIHNGDWELGSFGITDQTDIEVFCKKESGINEVAAMKGGKATEEANETCTVMGGRLPTAREALDEYETVSAALWGLFEDEPNPLCLFKESGDTNFWLADYWSPERGGWINPFSDEKYFNLSYSDVAPKGDEPCLIRANKLYAMSCKNTQPCTYCTLEKETKFILRGLCPEEMAFMDTEYVVHGVKNGRFHLRGTKLSHIYFKEEKGKSTWVLESLKSTLEGIRELRTNGHPFGSKDWFHRSASRCIGDGTLTLSPCKHDEFTCADGRCIPLSKKCNSIPDCEDQSDEFKCEFIRPGEKYLKNVVPRGREPGVKPMEIRLFATVQSIVNINTMDLKFTLDFNINARWYEDRLQYWDINDLAVLNSIGGGMLTEIWTPMIMMQNALGNEFMVYDEKSLSFIKKLQDNATLVGITSSSNALLFDGKQNPISVTRRYFQDFSCDMKLMAYPFDTQVCNVELVSLTQDQYSGSAVLLSTIKEVAYSGPEMLLEYKLINMTFEEVPKGADEFYCTAILKIVLKRRIEYHLTNTFLQTFVLVVVGFATCFFQLENFTDKIMVTLTTMLVTATIMGSIQSNLPKTSYYKLIDIWLLFTLLIQVTIFGLHTVVGAVVNKGKNGEVRDSAKHVGPQDHQANTNKRRSNAVNAAGKIVIFAVILGFNGIFWTVALGEYYKA